MAETPDTVTCLAQASSEVRNLIIYWINHGHTEHQGDGAAFAYQLASVAFGALTVNRFLDSLDPAQGAQVARQCHEGEFGFYEADVPEEWVLLQGLTLARAHIAGMASRRNSGETKVNINRILREAARDVLKLMGDRADKSVHVLASATDEQLENHAVRYQQRRDLAYGETVGNA